MSKVIKLKKGLDIKLNGEAEKVVQPAGKITSCALKPTDFRAMTPKLAVKVGDEVKAGDVLFIDKTHPEIKFTTPVSGTIEAINRGERRKLLEVVVKADAEIRYRDFGKTEVSKLNRDEIIDRLLESGVWPLIKQRPYDIIADPMSTPKAVFVSAFDSAPLAPDYDLILKQAEEHRMKSVSSALAHATVTTAGNLGAKCIIAPSMSGATSRVVSKFKPKTEIIGVTPNERTLRRMQMYWGVRPLKSIQVYTTEDICNSAIELICAKQLAETGDVVVLTAGIPSPHVAGAGTGFSNMMRIAVVE